MTAEEARHDDVVILGTFLVNDFSDLVLCNVGSSKSFASPTFCA